MSLHDGDVEMHHEGSHVSLHLQVPDTKPEKPNTTQRGYLAPYTIRFTGSQRDRFPAKVRPDIRNMLANDNDRETYPMGFVGEWEDFPRVARMRMNLTTLSQHYDLYFVAYRGYIHVYRPSRNAKSTLQGPPLAILDPERSKTPMAEFAHGHVNPTCPHEVNHMVIGNLGNKEILLISRDNGDVVAWYTHTIAHCIEARTAGARQPHARARQDSYREQPSSPKHFFATSVGLSAWGLAIHTKTRLIAVSSNTSEVTVFAFALDGEDADAQFEPHRPPPSSMDEGLERGRRRLDESFRTRKRTWRILITFGREASNLPSICFCDDPDGNADRIAATDVNGCLWVADIWRIGTRRIGILPHDVPYLQGRPYNNATGWNVLAVTDAQLLPTQSVRAATGLRRPRREVRRAKTARGVWYDISKSMAQVQDDAAHEDHIARMRPTRRQNASEYICESFRTAKALLSQIPTFDYFQDMLIPWLVPDSPHNGPAQALLIATGIKEAKTATTIVTPSDAGSTSGFLAAMTMSNATGEQHPELNDTREHLMFLKASAARKADFQKARPLPRCVEPENDDDGDNAEPIVSVRGLSFLRANGEDIEMLNLDPSSRQHRGGGGGVACHHVLPALTHDASLVPWDYHGLGKRVTMLLTIPALHLVILGSMHGRVALVTLTKAPSPPPQPAAKGASCGSTRAFRVDAVLPFQGEVRRQPWVCLLGIAVSPIPETRAQGLRLRKDGRRPTVYGGRRRQAAAETAAETETEPESEPTDTPRRWRLILNYQDHTILQYEISRREEEAAAKDGSLSWEARAFRKEELEEEEEQDGGGDGLGGRETDEGQDEDEDDCWPCA